MAPHTEQDPDSPISQSPIRMLPQASYPYPSEGRQNENHNHRKLTNLITWTTALSNSMKLWAMPCRTTQDRSWWRILTKCGPLEKGMANHFSILALRTPWTVWTVWKTDILSFLFFTLVYLHFILLIHKMSTFTLVISCMTTSNLPWFMDLTF